MRRSLHNFIPYTRSIENTHLKCVVRIADDVRKSRISGISLLFSITNKYLKLFKPRSQNQARNQI